MRISSRRGCVVAASGTLPCSVAALRCGSLACVLPLVAAGGKRVQRPGTMRRRGEAAIQAGINGPAPLLVTMSSTLAHALDPAACVRNAERGDLDALAELED